MIHEIKMSKSDTDRTVDILNAKRRARPTLGQVGQLGLVAAVQGCGHELRNRSWTNPRNVLADESAGGAGIDWESMIRLGEARRPRCEAERERLAVVLEILREEMAKEKEDRAGAPPQALRSSDTNVEDSTTSRDLDA